MPIRPMWMSVLMLFCADLLMKPLATDVDVWFGIALRGWAAKLSEPLFGGLTVALWRARPWFCGAST